MSSVSILQTPHNKHSFNEGIPLDSGMLHLLFTSQSEELATSEEATIGNPLFSERGAHGVFHLPRSVQLFIRNLLER